MLSEGGAAGQLLDTEIFKLSRPIYDRQGPALHVTRRIGKRIAKKKLAGEVLLYIHLGLLPPKPQGEVAGQAQAPCLRWCICGAR